MGVMIVLEGYRDGGVVEGMGVNVLYAFTALILLYLNRISYIGLVQVSASSLTITMLRISIQDTCSVLCYAHISTQNNV